MKLIITGGRNQRLSPANIAQLDSIKGVTELVSGNAKGIDQDAEQWAIERKIKIKHFKPDWKKFSRAAGPIRNREMAKYGEILAAFPGGAGTRNMIDEAQRAGLIIWNFTKKADENDGC